MEKCQKTEILYWCPIWNSNIDSNLCLWVCMGAPQAWAYESSSSFETIDGAPSRAKKVGGQVKGHRLPSIWKKLELHTIFRN